jgi:hypothetical protein
MKWKKGPMAELIKEISKKTKLKKDVVTDVLKELPESLLHVFFEQNSKPTEHVSFGFIRLSWNKTSKNHISISLRKTPSFSLLAFNHKKTLPTTTTTTPNKPQHKQTSTLP